MAKRLCDIVGSAIAIIVFGPVIALAAIGVRLSSPGPAFYCPQRAGLHGRPFTQIKLRTMHVDRGGEASSITGVADRRIFRLGSLLRRLKVDESPQLWNVLRGDMSLVGPRPEDPLIVERHYDDVGMSTLAVRPGLTGVGSLYNYTHGERMLTGPNPEETYVNELLPVKLALEAVYLRDASLFYDLKLMLRTVAAVVGSARGDGQFPDPPEMAAAREVLARV